MEPKTVNRYGRAFLVLMSVLFLWLGALNVSAADTTANSPEWKSVIFGQSTSETGNSISVDKANNTVTLTAGVRDGSATGGKIAGSHDGISFYYVEIAPSQNFELSAKVRVNFFAKPTPDNQEGFGIMARDAVGKHLDATIFASNMVMVGGYRGAVQSVFRNKVADVSGAGAVMEDVNKFGDRPANDGSATYLLKLKKTNTGYHVTVDNQPEKTYYRPKQLEVLDRDRIYVGFFAARVASITVSDIVLKTSVAAKDPPGVPEPPKEVVPQITVGSPKASSTAEYALSISANVKGRLEIKQNGTFIHNAPINSGETLVKNTALTLGNNTFDLVLTPETGGTPASLQFAVTYKTYGQAGGAIYVSSTGKPGSAGSESDPIDIYSAVQFVQPGQTVYVRGGTYNLTSPVLIERGNNGIADKPKMISAFSKEKPVFDFGKKSNGFTLAGDYWKVCGIDITNAVSYGLWVSGNHNRIELVNTYANGDTGMQVSGFSTEKIDKWPSYNLILNCTSYDNRDKAENNADGFAAKITCGIGNVFRGCISHNNCDDGFDLYSKLETGPIGAITIENCIAYGNGTLSDGTKTKGDGNGFKLGGEGLAVKHTLRNSLAFKNNTTGVTSNSDPAIVVENTTSVDNGRANYDFSFYSVTTPQFSAKNNISFRTVTGVADNTPANLKTADNYFFNGTDSVNAGGKKVSAFDFKSLNPVPFIRNTDGSIAVNDFMALAPSAGVTGGFSMK